MKIISIILIIKRIGKENNNNNNKNLINPSISMNISLIKNLIK